MFNSRKLPLGLMFLFAFVAALGFALAAPAFAQPNGDGDGDTADADTGDGDGDADSGDGDADTGDTGDGDTGDGGAILPEPADTELRAQPVAEPDAFQIVGQVRVRGEWLDDLDPYFATRGRVGVIWTPDPAFKIAVVIQDVRRFGQFGSSIGINGNTDLFEGYFTWAAFDFMTLTIGRISLSYDQQRLIGALDWAMQGRRFDVFHLRFGAADHKSDISIDAFWTPITTTFGGGAGPGSAGLFSFVSEWLAGVHAVLPFIEDHALSVYLYDYDRDLGVAGSGINVATFGVFFARSGGGAIVYDAEIAVQVGDVNYVVGTTFAYAGHFVAGYKFEEAGLKLVAEGNIASGEKVGTTQSEAFTNLFPTNHNKYGYIDRQNWSNTINAALRLWYDLSVDDDSAPISIELSAWIFFRMEGTGSPDSFLGALPASTSDLKAFEIDLLAKHKFEDFFVALFGVTLWVPGDLAKAAGFNNADLFIYAQFHFNLS